MSTIIPRHLHSTFEIENVNVADDEVIYLKPYELRYLKFLDYYVKEKVSDLKERGSEIS